MPDYDNVHIKILRGVHDLGMVDDVVKVIKGADIAFFETVGSKELKAELTAWLQRINTDPKYAESVGKEFTAESPNPFMRIVWQLRGSKTLFILVDKTLDVPTEDYIDDNTSPFSDPDFDQLIKTKDFELFYAGTEKHVAAQAQEIRARDKLVARQVKNAVDYCIKEKLPHDKLAIVQGVLHYSKPYLQRLLPGVKISELGYNRERTVAHYMNPAIQTKLQKLMEPDKPVGPEHIDRLLYICLKSAIEIAKDQLDTLEPEQHRGESRFDPDYSVNDHAVAALQAVPREQLHAQVVDMLDQIVKLDAAS